MLNIVLYEPEIPQNTGNIIRSCVAAKARLHLIEPLGFRMNNQALKRSGVTYLEFLDYKVYPSYEAFLAENDGIMYYLSRYGIKGVNALELSKLEENYYFILGKESTGIPLEILQKNIDKTIRLPMSANVRALNLSNVAAIILYEALRQQGFPGLALTEPETLKGKDYILK